MRDRGDDAVVEQPVPAHREHRAVDVGEPHLARRPDAARERAREVARAAGDVEHALAARTPLISSANAFHSGAGRAT